MKTNGEGKSLIRKRIREKKGSLTKEEQVQAELSCMKRVLETNEWKQAEEIQIYVSYNQEMGTEKLIEAAWQQGKRVASPRVEEDHMNFYLYTSFSQLEKSSRHILEPAPLYPAGGKNVLVIMPGVAFDKNRNRIGYGGGFYDRYLALHPEYHKIAIAYDFQIIDEIRPEEHDIRPELVITESNTI